MGGGRGVEEIVGNVLSTAELPSVNDADVLHTIESLYGRDNLIQRIRENPDQFLLSDDPRLQVFQELSQINAGLDRRGISEQDGARLRARRAEIWVGLRASLSDEEYERAVPNPELFAQSPELLRQIATNVEGTTWGYARNPAERNADELARAQRHSKDLLRSLPPEVFAQLREITLQNVWRDSREGYALQIRKVLIDALPPVGDASQPSNDETGGTPERSAFWEKVQIYYLKKIGDTAPGPD